MKIKWFPHKSEFPIDPAELTEKYYAIRWFPIFLAIAFSFFLVVGIDVLYIKENSTFYWSFLPAYFLWLSLAFMVVVCIVWLFYTKDAIMVGLTEQEMYIFLSGFGYCKCPWKAIERTEIVTTKSGFGRRRRVDRDLLIFLKHEYKNILPKGYDAARLISKYDGDLSRVILLHDGPVPIDEVKQKIDEKIKGLK